jgi:DNA-binding response OmpR family regulator
MKPLRVLIVDDEEDFASAIVSRLNKRGFTAFAAFSGQEALEHVKSAEYDAIVLDLRMPEMDGLKTLGRIRQIDPDVRVLVLTGHGTVAEGIGGMQLGAADFLQKPVEINILCASIEAAAEQTRSDRAQKLKHDINLEGEKR